MKDPAFLFYSSDFLTGVLDLTFEERGQYITLLCIQHQKGRLTPKAVKMAAPGVSEDVLGKFAIDSDGNLYNERLEIEAEKRAKHSKKQSERALAGWEKRKKGKAEKEAQVTTPARTAANATALPLKDANRNESENQIQSIRTPFCSLELTTVFEKWLHACEFEVPLNKRKKRGPSAIEQLQMKLSTMPEDRAILIVQQSLANGWVNLQPLEELKSNNDNETKRPWEE